MKNITVSVRYQAGALKASFEEHGILVFPDFLDSERLGDLNDEITAHYKPIVEDAKRAQESSTAGIGFDVEVVPWDPIGDGSDGFTRLAQDALLRNLTESVLGADFSAPRALVMWSVGGGKGQAWHQDCPPDDPQAFNMNRLFYMQDTRQEDGAIVVVPGSHRAGRIPAGGSQEPIDGEIVLTPAAGTLVFLHGHVYHRVTPNVSGKPRVSVNLRAYPQGISDQVNRIGIYRNGAYDFAEGGRLDR